MLWLLFFIHSAEAQLISTADVLGQMASTRGGISEDERRQREALSTLFTINKQVHDIGRKQEQLSQKLVRQEASVSALAQDVVRLEQRKDAQKDQLNHRLRQLYQERDENGFHWLFSAQSPIELERNHRFLRKMIDSDHRQLKSYLSDLLELKNKRIELRDMVGRLALMQKQAKAQEVLLGQQLNEKSRLLSELKKSKALKLTELQGLRAQHSELSEALTYAFFERKGLMASPVEARHSREFGTYMDSQFHFRLTQKGLFYSVNKSDVHAIFRGQVAFAGALPGYGSAVILDHGDNYYSVYGFNGKLKVHEGARVEEGEVVAVSGDASPLFGPGLYFEIRHFTDAIDPRPWIKESLLKSAKQEVGSK